MNERQLIDLAGDLGTIFAFVIVNAIMSTLFYLIISLMIGIPVTYLQIFGVMLLASLFLRFIKNILEF